MYIYIYIYIYREREREREREIGGNHLLVLRYSSKSNTRFLLYTRRITQQIKLAVLDK